MAQLLYFTVWKKNILRYFILKPFLLFLSSLFLMKYFPILYCVLLHMEMQVFKHIYS